MTAAAPTRRPGSSPGSRYELQLRKLGVNNNPYTLAENVDVAFCSLISDGEFQGAKVSRSSTRAYETTYAAHVLGLVGSISDYTDELKEQGYKRSDTIGISGAEPLLKSTSGAATASGSPPSTATAKSPANIIR